jgi:hypothetical protein
LRYFLLLVLPEVALSQATFRAEVQNLHQAIALVGDFPHTAAGEKVFCDTVNFSLLLAPADAPAASITINSITVKVEDLKPSQTPVTGSCKIDRFSSQPHGIIDRNVYFFRIDDGKVVGRFVRDASGAEQVDASNILQFGNSRKAVSLTRGRSSDRIRFFLSNVCQDPQAGDVHHRLRRARREALGHQTRRRSETTGFRCSWIGC